MASDPDIIDAEYQATALAVAPAHAAAPVPQFFALQSPKEKVAFATEVADALKPIITAKGLAHKLNARNPDDEYVELEAWQTCAFLCGMTAKVVHTEPLPTGDGFLARAVVVRVDTGLEIGAGESQCSRKERNWSSRDAYALRGMAQTRAQSRALRGVLAWILVLAGYKPTPSEEMPPAGTSEPAPAGQNTPAPATRAQAAKEPAKRTLEAQAQAATARYDEAKARWPELLAQLSAPEQMRVYTMALGSPAKPDPKKISREQFIRCVDAAQVVVNEKTGTVPGSEEPGELFDYAKEKLGGTDA